ncbi:MAG: response regulator transcription factor [Anaerolineae bacterium]|nr:response regulator transcription factor [Anaerolineae bacterium]
MEKERILVVDDEPAIVQVIRDRLLREGYEVRAAGDGPAALASVAQDLPDLMILDLMLPGIDGLEVLRRLRQGGEEAAGLPVIVLTARDDEVDVIVGLELGADDYVVKPFNPRELVARVRAVLRRRREALALAGRLADLEARLDPPSPAQGGPGLRVDPTARRAWFLGQPLDLRPREFDLLYFMTQRAGQVLSRDVLLDAVWGTAEFIDDRTVDVHVHRLRQKLAEIDPEADPIQTERGLGYRFEP